MSKVVEVKGKKYLYETNYKDNEHLRKSFNDLAQKTFGIDFEEWYQEGYWGEGYIAYSLIDDGKVVANVSASIMKFMLNGEKKTYIQIGTVMTADKYRKMGLGRFLMEKVIGEWKDKCDLIYLFANDSALNFYPKFGFVKSDEYEYSTSKINISESSSVRKINLDDYRDRNIFINIIENTKVFSKLAIMNNINLVMFYCISFMKNDIYFIEEYNSIVIANFFEDTLYIQEVFAINDAELENIIGKMISNDINKVVLGFTPINTLLYDEKILDEEDTTLFIMAKDKNPIELGKLRFPILSHA